MLVIQYPELFQESPLRSNSCWICLVLLVLASVEKLAATPPLQTLSYQSTTEEFNNPERGFLRFGALTDPSKFALIRRQGYSLAWSVVRGDEFRNQPLSQAFLDTLQTGFNAARANGLKIKFRFAYNYSDDGLDAPKSVILGHIQQLKPLWEQNKDVIYMLDAGFIGKWGEWHGSSSGLDNATDRSQILHAILDALPTDRTVGLRYPHHKREIFTGSQTSGAAVITAANAFDGSDLSRVGHLNDCFLSSSNDVGTYRYLNSSWPLSRELDYIGGESRFAVHGGETCAPHARNDTVAAIAEMEKLHTDYMNIDYNADVYQKWKDDGRFAEIQRRLGYRFELVNATLPTEVRPKGLMPLEFTIKNVGFGELFNARNVEVVLRNSATGALTTATLDVDPRFWSGGTTNTVSTALAMPENLPEGTYSIGLKMPDIEASLRNDARYSIRFANQGVWDATGINILANGIVISNSAPGAAFEMAPTFVEVTALSPLRLIGDYNEDGLVNAMDYGVWKQAFGQTVAGFASADGNGDGAIDAADYTVWRDAAANFTSPTQLAQQVVPEPASWILLAVGIVVAMCWHSQQTES